MANEQNDTNALAATQRADRGGAMEQAAANREMAEVQAAMVVANRFPRDQIKALDRIKQSCTRVGLAEQAMYSYARGGQDITGPSIRLAEAIAQAWGNMDFGIRELSRSDEESVMQAYAWDLETNTRVTRTFVVPHVRHTRRGSYALEDPRDIYEATANQGSRRLRACILEVVPGDVVEEAVAQCEQTLHSKADTSPEAIQKMVKAFGEFGVTKAMIETRIQRRLDAIRPAQIIDLKKVYASIRDGMSAPTDWFESETGSEDEGSRTEQLAKDLKGKKSKGKTDAQEKPAKGEEAPEPPDDGERDGKAKTEADSKASEVSDGSDDPRKSYAGPPWLDEAQVKSLRKRADQAGLDDDEWAEILMDFGAEGSSKIPAAAEQELFDLLRDLKKG